MEDFFCYVNSEKQMTKSEISVKEVLFESYPVDSAIQRLKSRGLTDKPEAQDALILSPFSLHQCSVLQVFKSYLKVHEKKRSRKKD